MMNYNTYNTFQNDTTKYLWERIIEDKNNFTVYPSTVSIEKKKLDYINLWRKLYEEKKEEFS